MKRLNPSKKIYTPIKLYRKYIYKHPLNKTRVIILNSADDACIVLRACWITCMSQTWGGPRLDPVTTLRPSVAIRQQSTRTSSPAAPGVTAPLEVALYCTIWFPAWFAIIVRTFWTCEKSIFLELKFCFRLFKSYDKSKSGGIYHGIKSMTDITNRDL